MTALPDLLLHGGTLIDPVNGTSESADVLIRGGQIAAVGDAIEAPSGVERVDCAGRMLSPGWMDMHVHFREPGQEHKETIETGCRAAAFGGFTAVACMPNTDPPIHTRDVVDHLRNAWTRRITPACRTHDTRALVKREHTATVE